MNVSAQEYFIIGAMCIDEEFRNAVFATGDPYVQGTSEETLRGLLNEYGRSKEFVLNADQLVPHVMAVVRGPCRLGTLEKMPAVKAALCPCWPC